MKINLELNIEQLTLILARYEGGLMNGDKVYYSQRHALYDVYKQLPDEYKVIFEKQLPLLAKEILN